MWFLDFKKTKVSILELYKENRSTISIIVIY